MTKIAVAGRRWCAVLRGATQERQVCESNSVSQYPQFALFTVQVSNDFPSTPFFRGCFL